MTRRGWGLFGAMSVIWGIPYLLIKVAIRDFSPAALILSRTAVGALLLVPVALATGQLRPVLRRWKLIVAYTAVEIAIPWVLLPQAEHRLSSSLSGLLVAAVPLMGAVLGLSVKGRHRLTAAQVTGLVVGLGGVVVLAGLDVSGAAWSSVVEVAVVVVSYAAGPLILSRWLSGLPALGVVAASLGLCALAYLPVGLAQMPTHVPPARVLAAVVVLGVICTALAFLLFFALITEIGPVRATVITYVNPVVAVTLGVVLLHEHAGASTAAGAGLILAGSLLANGRYPRRRALLAADEAEPASIMPF
ncbi:MAG: DMT family transporter [Actinomycetota bacterium]|nr:DMT family transporter [Actinomycetota bacterium]